jgi:hypothetical protein
MSLHCFLLHFPETASILLYSKRFFSAVSVKSELSGNAGDLFLVNLLVSQVVVNVYKKIFIGLFLTALGIRLGIY